MNIIVMVVAAFIAAAVIINFADDMKVHWVILLSLGVGVVLGVLAYVGKRFPEFSWLYLILLVAFIGGLMYQWYRRGSGLLEFLCFTGLTVITGGVACIAAANYASATIIPLFIAVLVPIFAVGFYGYTAMQRNYDANCLTNEERELLSSQKMNESIDELDAKASKFNTLRVVVAIVAIAALAGATGIVLGMADSGLFEGAPDGADAGIDNAMAAEVNAADGSEAVPEEVEEYLVKWTKKESNRIDSEFADKLKAEAGDGEITADIVKEVILQDCKEDPSVLAIWGYNFGLYDDPDKYEPLMTKEDGKEKLSDKGVQLYNKIEGYLEAVTAVREDAPEGGVNTGYDDGYVVASESGISGDRSGTKITCPNGDYFWVMDRCANIVYRPSKTPKNVPRGDTDEPKKPKVQKKEPSEDPVNQGNADKGGGQNKKTDGAGENQPNDPRTEHPTGSQNDNNHGHSDPATVTPSNPPVTNEHKSEPVVTDSKPMDYKPDTVTNNGPADSSKKPTSSEGDGEFTPAD